jgi:hypothetical protein
MPQFTRRDVVEILGGNQQLHLRFQHAQHLQTSAGIPIWVVRGTNIVCIVRANKVAVGCGTRLDAERHGLTLEVYRLAPPPKRDPTRFIALGLAPDWAKAVRIRIGGHGRRTVPILGNTFSLAAAGPIFVERLVR